MCRPGITDIETQMDEIKPFNSYHIHKGWGVDGYVVGNSQVLGSNPSPNLKLKSGSLLDSLTVSDGSQ